jgi:hypothetical protein
MQGHASLQLDCNTNFVVDFSIVDKLLKKHGRFGCHLLDGRFYIC